MLKKSIYSLIITLFFTQIVSAGQTDKANNPQLEKLGIDMMYFYQHPQQNQFQEIQEKAVKLLPKQDKHLPAFLVWVDVASKKYGWEINDDFFPELMNEIHNPNSPMAQFIADDKIISPTKLDMWWASFFATGESQYVRKVFNQAIKLKATKQVIDAKQKKTRREMIMFATLMSAEWSFKSNCQQHAKIRKFSQHWQKENDLTTEARALLDYCVSVKKAKK